MPILLPSPHVVTEHLHRRQLQPPARNTTGQWSQAWAAVPSGAATCCNRLAFTVRRRHKCVPLHGMSRLNLGHTSHFQSFKLAHAKSPCISTRYATQCTLCARAILPRPIVPIHVHPQSCFISNTAHAYLLMPPNAEAAVSSSHTNVCYVICTEAGTDCSCVPTYDTMLCPCDGPKTNAVCARNCQMHAFGHAPGHLGTLPAQFTTACGPDPASTPCSQPLAPPTAALPPNAVQSAFGPSY